MEQPGEVEGASPIRGEIRFVDAGALQPMRGAAQAAGVIYAEFVVIEASVRGQLGEFVEAAVEGALAAAGVAPSSGGATSDWGVVISDQVSRAIGAGFRGVVVAMGSLERLADVAGVLDPDDCRALRAWALASRQLPVVVALDRRSQALAGYGAPVALQDLLGVSPAPPRRTTPPVEVAVASEGKQTEVRASDERPAGEARAAEPPAIDSREWAAYAAELHAARGPKPLPVVERMFVSRYVALAEAEMLGVADAFGRQVRAEWAVSFSRSYGEAFKALGVTGKRPTMVLDLPQLAGRVARLHGARGVELFLVDGMRFDLGARVQQRLRRGLGGRAACAEQMLLWSALPTTTTTQLDLLAHGPEGLSRPMVEEHEEAMSVVRGRSVTTPRRVKVGQRDVLKLDLVEARLRENGPPVAERLDGLSEEIAAAVLRHAETLPDRTLLVVFGDHGFVIDSTAGGSGPARQGGASPEEVLVPAFAWLLGGVQ